MKAEIIDSISIDAYAATPKYQQLANSIVQTIYEGKLKIGDKLPSLNECYEKLDISKDSVERSYKRLIKSGLIKSVPYKGYYVSNTAKSPYRILFLLNKLSEFKKIIYDTFVNSMKGKSPIDVRVYNNDIHLFKRLLQNVNEYSHIVILPHFNSDEIFAFEIINEIPKSKLVILDRAIPSFSSDHITVCQNFKKDIYHGLKELNPSLTKYNTIKILFTKGNCFPQEIVDGFKMFCQDFAYEYEIVNELAELNIASGETYICLTDNDMALIIDRIEELGYEMGKSIGIISYNETSIKKFIRKGITTISTDFSQIGKKGAELILDNRMLKVEVPFQVKLRPSL